MAAKLRSVAGKIVLAVVTVAMIGHLFSSSADAGEAAVAAPPQKQPQCNPVLYVSPDCDTWCTNEGHPGGYVKGDVCCCNSGAGLSADS
ncbi:unnamed protein product [Urochloa humidicola]